VATPDGLAHRRFDQLAEALRPGDLLVVNDSATMPAALAAEGRDGTPLRLHFSTPLPGGLWTAEVREPDGVGTRRLAEPRPAGEVLRLPGGGRAELLAPYPVDVPDARLQHVRLELPQPLDAYLAVHGAPIRYGHTAGEWPLEAYQTIFATGPPGSAEMPSAGR